MKHPSTELDLKERNAKCVCQFMVCVHCTCICYITSHNRTAYIVIEIQEMATINHNLIQL
jgi:hypothetical protein